MNQYRGRAGTIDHVVDSSPELTFCCVAFSGEWDKGYIRESALELIVEDKRTISGFAVITGVKSHDELPERVHPRKKDAAASTGLPAGDAFCPFQVVKGTYLLRKAPNSKPCREYPRGQHHLPRRQIVRFSRPTGLAEMCGPLQPQLTTTMFEIPGRGRRIRLGHAIWDIGRVPRGHAERLSTNRGWLVHSPRMWRTAAIGHVLQMGPIA